MTQLSKADCLARPMSVRAKIQMAAGVVEALAEFGRQKISYCYWKSATKLESALCGDGDIDILVARTDQNRAQAILLSRDFKFFPSVGDREAPAVFTYLCYDEPSGRLLHIHLHLRLVVGGPLAKNWHLPWEDTVLSRAAPHAYLPVRQVDSACEALLLLTRNCLELGGWDPVSIRRGAAKRKEFDDARLELASRVECGDLRRLAAGFLSDDVADMVVDSLFSDQSAAWRAPLARAIRRHLSTGGSSYNGPEARLRSVGRSIVWVAGRLNKAIVHAPRPWHRRPAGGGIVVAFVGVDGSGKSTLIAALKDWLGIKVDVLPIYFGTGDGRPSLYLRPLKWLMPLATWMLGRKPRVASHGKASAGPPSLAYSILLAVWAIAVAADKRVKLTATWRAANRGLVVLADRYPQNESKNFNDGPLLERVPAVPEWLRHRELGVYQLAHRLPPDLVLKLMAPSETLAAREPAMDITVISRRLDALAGLAFGNAEVVCIDVDRPLDEVIRSVKRAIWQCL
ncbi:hypothetical protein [Mesorhizobium muleiense]|uniref:Thymidylate kinase n=1 Tax=Mesorhizobium muleiense TaxID=1004279 RepID=A0A1G8L4L8_9HYPH|nr:hypothetical protein [Mesorhizobium muleiense]MCF6100415.1 hypothetical protein [Mesorhizobium muleiense]SDI50644.1 Thymidylate kinase [Mesorhizobium muleiense]